MFLDLEASHGLNVRLRSHCWLLCHLYLDLLNRDALAWIAAWNCHKMDIRGQRPRCPEQMFYFGMIQNGPRGISTLRVEPPLEEDIPNLEEYGVDWEALEDEELMEHHLETNDFVPVGAPPEMAEVFVEPFDCPLNPAQVRQLNEHMVGEVDVNSNDMLVRRRMWVVALTKCRSLYGGFG